MKTEKLTSISHICLNVIMTLSLIGSMGPPAHEEVSLTGGSVPQKAVDLNTGVKLHLNVRNEIFPKDSLASDIRSKASKKQPVSEALADISIRA